MIVAVYAHLVPPGRHLTEQAVVNLPGARHDVIGRPRAHLFLQIEEMRHQIAQSFEGIQVVAQDHRRRPNREGRHVTRQVGQEVGAQVHRPAGKLGPGLDFSALPPSHNRGNAASEPRRYTLIGKRQAAAGGRDIGKRPDGTHFTGGARQRRFFARREAFR